MGPSENFGFKSDGNERVSPEIEQNRKEIETVVSHLENIRGRLIGVIDEAGKIFFPEESFFMDSLLDMLDCIDQSQGIIAQIALDNPAHLKEELSMIDRWVQVLIDNADFLLGGDNIAPGVLAPHGIKKDVEEIRDYPLWNTSWLPAIKKVRQLAQAVKERKAE